MQPQNEKSFEIKAKINLRDTDIVILNGIPFSAEFLETLKSLFTGETLTDDRQHIIAGVSSHLWFMRKHEGESPFCEHDEDFVTGISYLFDAMKIYGGISQFESR